MLIHTKRLIIRALVEDDWEALLSIWADFSQSPYAQYDRPRSLDPDENRAKARLWAEVTPAKAHMFFAVCLNGEMIGLVDFHQQADGYECGYCFHSKAQGKGYARESLQALFRWLTEQGAGKVMAGTALNNLPSVRLLMSLGFQKVGEEKVSFYQDEDGQPIWFDGGIFERNLHDT